MKLRSKKNEKVLAVFLCILLVVIQYIVIDYNEQKNAEQELEQFKQDSILLINTYIYEHSKITDTTRND